jgi:hypothetical protein
MPRQGAPVSSAPAVQTDFDPGTEYEIRSRNWEYPGVTERFRFSMGVAVAPRMKENATEEQLASRLERLRRLTSVMELQMTDAGISLGQRPSYTIYERGEAPSMETEPMWADQQPPEGFVKADSGEIDDGQWVPSEKRAHPDSRLKPDGSAGFDDKQSQPDDGTGEAAPQSQTVPATPRAEHPLETTQD